MWWSQLWSLKIHSVIQRPPTFSPSQPCVFFLQCPQPSEGAFLGRAPVCMCSPPPVLCRFHCENGCTAQGKPSHSRGGGECRRMCRCAPFQNSASSAARCLPATAHYQALAWWLGTTAVIEMCICLCGTTGFLIVLVATIKTISPFEIFTVQDPISGRGK